MNAGGASLQGRASGRASGRVSARNVDSLNPDSHKAVDSNKVQNESSGFDPSKARPFSRQSGRQSSRLSARGHLEARGPSMEDRSSTPSAATGESPTKQQRGGDMLQTASAPMQAAATQRSQGIRREDLSPQDVFRSSAGSSARTSARTSARLPGNSSPRSDLGSRQRNSFEFIDVRNSEGSIMRKERLKERATTVRNTVRIIACTFIFCVVLGVGIFFIVRTLQGAEPDDGGGPDKGPEESVTTTAPETGDAAATLGPELIADGSTSAGAASPETNGNAHVFLAAARARHSVARHSVASWSSAFLPEMSQGWLSSFK